MPPPTPAPRHLAQPGPILSPRVVTLPGHAVPLAFTLAPGLSLLEAVGRPLREAGFASAVLVLEGGGFGAFEYVLPAPAPDTTHAAWYSATHRPAGGARLERANITFGLRDDRPWLHGHAVWREADGRRAGHVLPEETIIAAPIAARAFGLIGVGFVTGPDPETNFSLFQPVAQPGLAPPASAARVVALRSRPNTDAATALAEACQLHGFAGAVLRGGVGSLVGARFEGGGQVEDYATEMLVTGGQVVADGSGGMRAELAIALADMQGRVHEGRLLRGQNPVCITFEAVLEETH